MTNSFSTTTVSAQGRFATKKRRLRAALFSILCLVSLGTAFAEDEYFVVRYYSATTDSGIVGLRPGTRVVVSNLKEGTFRYGGKILSIPWEFLCEKEEDVQAAAAQDAAEQDMIKKKVVAEREKAIAQEQAKLKSQSDHQADATKKLNDAQKQGQ